MNSLFVRIYWGMLISVIVVVCLGYVTLQAVNDKRYQAYRDHHFASLLKVMSENMQDLDYDERYRWVGEINRRLDGELSMHSPHQLKLTPGVLSRFIETGTYVDYDDSTSSISAYLFIKQDDLSIRLTLDANTKEYIPAMASVLFDFVSERNINTPEQLNINVLEGLNQEGFIGLQNELNRKRLLQGEMIVTSLGFDHLSADGRPQEHFNSRLYVAQIRDREKLMVYGPVEVFDWYPAYLLIGFGALGLIILGVVGFLLVRPLENGMKQMEVAIDDIRKGDLNARVFIDTNDAIGHLATTINEMAEHIQRLIKSQREMTNAVSHELRTPVARIRFGLQIIQDYVENPSVDAQIEKLDEDIEELERLIDEILTYATLEEGKPALNLEAINVVTIAQEIRQQSLAQGHSIQIEVCNEVKNNADQMVECERRYIHRAIQNLVNNAVKYANSTVRVVCSAEGGMYRVDVEDDGPGIPKDQWQHVFTPFARLDSSRNRSTGGYGLGLSIVQSIAYWHGGVAAVYFSAMGGAKFTILWPRTQEIRKKIGDDQSKG